MNSWCWESEEAFKKRVHPIEHAPGNAVRVAQFFTGLERVKEFYKEIRDLENACIELKRIIGLAANEPASRFSEDQFREVWSAACRIVQGGEYALAYCKLLVETKGGEEFIRRKEIFEHLLRYQKEEWGSCRWNANQLLQAAERFLSDIYDFWETGKSFLNNVSVLPEDLKVDFVAARDVISLGYNEAGLIYAGRGLEGVVRRIAKDHKIAINGGKIPIERARFFDILTILAAKRFSHDQSLVIDEQTKQRLQLSRVMRNYSTHPNEQRGSQGYYEEAILMAQKANELWKKCSVPGIKFI